MVITVARNPIVQLGFALGEHHHKLAASTPLSPPRNLPFNLHEILLIVALFFCLRGFPSFVLSGVLDVSIAL